jgi:arylsulfatase A-like enzyme
MSLHGYQRQTTPHLARFAERANVYHAHYSAGNFTTPGTASLLTGVYPWSHRALHRDGQVTKVYEDRNLFALFGESYNRIAYPQNTLAHLLLDRFREHIDIYLPPEEFGLIGGTLPSLLFSGDPNIAYRSFEKLLFRDWSYPGSLFFAFADKLKLLTQERVRQRELTERYPKGAATMIQYKWQFLLEDVIDGLQHLLSSAGQPYLAYLHLFPPHEPYRPHRDFIGFFDDGWKPTRKPPHALSHGHSQEALDELRTEYDEYLAYTDAEFGRLYDFLDRSGILNTSYVIITSDHGQLFERGVHGHITELLYEPVIHVPLLMSRPGQQRRQDITVTTSGVDLLPTLLHLIGEAIPEWCEGQIVPASSAEPSRGERSIFVVEAKHNQIHQPLTRGTVALIRDRHKLIHYFGHDGYDNVYELYDLENDPEELEDVYPLQGPVARDLQNELDQKLREVNQPYTR